MDRDTRIEIDLKALEHNAAALKQSLREGVQLMAIVKADGYGHGIAQAATAFLRGGASLLGVAIPQEGQALRDAGIGLDVLMLGATSKDGALLSVKNDLIQTAHSVEALRAMQAAAETCGRPARAHVKVETGMHRLGALPGEELHALLDALGSCPDVRIEGIYTHFAAAAEDEGYTRRQHQLYLQAVQQAEAKLGPLFQHAANSAAALSYPESHLDAVRVGIALYGCPPCDTSVELRPAMRFVTSVSQLHDVLPGETVGYGRTFTAQRPSRIATIPAGYGDGYPRAIGNRGYALVHGMPAPIVGRICMDQAMLDVTDIPGVHWGDEVTLMGSQGKASLPAEALADWCGTIPYEILLRPTARVPRVYRPNG